MPRQAPDGGLPEGGRALPLTFRCGLSLSPSMPCSPHSAGPRPRGATGATLSSARDARCSPVLRDIRELKDDPAAYAAELRRRWTGLLSYRYIGRNHGAMNTGPVDNTVSLRRDMRNAVGGLLVAPLSISSPEGNVGSDLVAVPNPVIHCCQILDDARGVKRIEVVESEVLRSGARMGYSRSKIVDADDPSRVIAFTEGQGVRIGTPPEGLEKMESDKLEIVDSPDLP